MPRFKKLKRPFKNLYYTDMHSPDPAWASQGNCSTEDNAKRHGWVRLGMKMAVRCAIVDRHTGAVIYTLTRTAHGVNEHFGYHAEQPRLRRIK